MDIQKHNHDQKKMYFIPIEYYPNYKDKIRQHLNNLMMIHPKTQWKQLVHLLKLFKYLSTGRQLAKNANYQVLQNPQLQKDMNTPIIELLSKMARVVLQMEGQFKQRNIQILQRYQNHQIQFTKDQILYVMCLLALNLLPDQLYAQNQKISQNYQSSVNFSYIFSHHVYKTKAIINYFIINLNNPFMDKKSQQFIIRRKCLQQSIGGIIKIKGSLNMIPYKLRRDDESIQSFSGSGKVDFANEYIGGGALHGPCVQEQIMFANCPEMFVSMVFCQSMDFNQAIVLEGFKKYSSNTGYAQSTKFDHNYEIDWEKFYKVNEYVIAIDAFCFLDQQKQFSKQLIDRELIKSYCGFSNLKENIRDVVTGNWGCGAFGGQMTVKFMIQWISCSLAGKRMLYCPFGSSKRVKDTQEVMDILSKKKIKEVYEIVLEACKKMKNGETNIFKKIESLIR